MGNKYYVDKIGLSNAKVMIYDDKVVKIDLVNENSNNEYVMMKWLENKLPVPKILSFEVNDNVSTISMTRVKGFMLSDIIDDPFKIVDYLHTGLKMLWSVDITDCPRLFDIYSYIDSITIDENNKDIVNYLKFNIPRQELVFSHGDYCLPNIFVNNDLISFIDLGFSGINDKYYDIYTCLHSLEMNLIGKFSKKPISIEMFNKVKIYFLNKFDFEIDYNKLYYYEQLYKVI